LPAASRVSRLARCGRKSRRAGCPALDARRRWPRSCPGNHWAQKLRSHWGREAGRDRRAIPFVRRRLGGTGVMGPENIHQRRGGKVSSASRKVKIACLASGGGLQASQIRQEIPASALSRASRATVWVGGPSQPALALAGGVRSVSAGIEAPPRRPGHQVLRLLYVPRGTRGTMRDANRHGRPPRAAPLTWHCLPPRSPRSPGPNPGPSPVAATDHDINRATIRWPCGILEQKRLPHWRFHSANYIATGILDPDVTGDRRRWRFPVYPRKLGVGLS
jgi:hypothetical protein